MKINQLVKEAHENALRKGWWDEEKSFGELVALMHSELSEALEEFRNNTPALINRDAYSIYYRGNDYIASEPTESCKKPEGIPIELADCIIRIFDSCGKEKIDLKTRPYKHGGKKL